MHNINKLSFRLIGLIYLVYNRLQYGHKEKIYQQAFEQLLLKEKNFYYKELYCPIKFEEKVVGRYYLDFLIDKKIVVELKVADDIYPKHIKQVLNYLKARSIKLGLIFAVSKDSVKIKRLINT